MVSIGTIIKVTEEYLLVSYNNTIRYERKANYISAPGEDASPDVGDKVYAEDLKTRAKRVILGINYSNSKKKAAPGERRVFSKGGAEVWLKNDGTVYLNGDGRTFMTYSDFANNWNMLVMWLQTHTHQVIAEGSPTSTPLEPIGTNISDISSSEVEKVETGSND